MNQLDQIEKIKRRLGVESSESDRIIIDLFDDALTVALNTCNLSQIDTSHKAAAILAIVSESTVSLYNQRGNEGTTGYTTGGQGASYEPVYKAMREKLIGAGCRAWR